MSSLVLFPERTIFLELFGFEIHWYGLLYVVGFFIAWLLLPKLQRYRSLHLTKDEWLTILTWSVAGVLIGGRLGYVLFYEPMYFIQHPLEIVAIWQGGMSSHGGFIGVAIGLWYACKKIRCNFFAVTDMAVIPAAIGLALGRVGNFINQELYGTVTALPWGIEIPGVEGTRHPVQLYAVIKDLGIAGACYWYLVHRQLKEGQVTAIFLMLYGILRFVVEYFRTQDWPLVFGFLTRGQLLTIPVFLFGIWLYRKKNKNI